MTATTQARLDPKLILKTATLAGKILMQSGSDTMRVEDTMSRIIKNALKEHDEIDFDIFVILNVVFVRIGTFKTSFSPITNRSSNLTKIEDVNQISRDFAEERITLSETYEQLQKVYAKKFNALSPSCLLAALLLGGSIIFLYQGTFRQIVPAMLGGLTSYFVYHVVSQVLDLPFASEFIATFIGGIVAIIGSSLFHANINIVTIGTVVPLVPGIAVTNSIREIMDRNYMTGLIRFIESICIGAALGGGMALAFFLFGR